MSILTASHVTSHLTKLNDKINFAVRQIWFQLVEGHCVVYKFKWNFHHVNIYEDGSIFLICTYSRLNEKCIICFFRKYSEASRKPFSFYGLWSNRNFLLNLKVYLIFQIQNDIILRCVNFATYFTLLSSKISSPVFSVSHTLQIFFSRWI